MRHALRTLALALIVATPSLAQVAPVPAPPAATTAPAESVRVAVIGASASAGFGCVMREKRADGDYALGFRLIDMVRLACPELEIVSTDMSSGFFFLAPVKNGSTAAARAVAFKPDCVIALDFLFWYCYGDDSPKGGRITDEAERLEKLELGLKELEKFEVPVLVGDLPDMSPAVGKMLAPAQMPAKDTLVKANARFAEWAKGRANIRVVPLADMQRQLMEERALEIRGVRLESTKQAPLLQRDELHPAPHGMAGLACAVAAEMKDALTEAESTASVQDGCVPEPNSTIQRATAALKPSGTRPKPATEGASKPAVPATQLSATR
ncbi:MAG: hypothetical protein RLY21_856 [Planctomycetota bacterium]|jgi:hypothetical protein